MYYAIFKDRHNIITITIMGSFVRFSSLSGNLKIQMISKLNQIMHTISEFKGLVSGKLLKICVFFLSPDYLRLGFSLT